MSRPFVAAAGIARAGTAPADQLADALDLTRDAERRRAVRALLRHPLLTPAQPDPALFRLVRRHAAWLREWFTREAGWTLLVGASVARLYKVPADTSDGTRPATTAPNPGTAWSRRRYALACLALAALERAEAQVTLGRLVERVVGLAADPELEAAGVTFRLDGRDERSDLAAVARLLLGLGVLRRVAGDEQAFVNRTGDALYDIDRQVLASLLGARRGPSMLAATAAARGSWSSDASAVLDQRIAAIVDEPRPDTDELRTRAIRHALARRLLDDPVVYFADLREDELAYLRTQRSAMLARLAEGSGLVAEVRAEGMALVDPTGESTDLGMPEEGTDGHVTLLLAEYLAGRFRAEPAERVPIAHLEAHLSALVDIHRRHWRKDASEPGAERHLTRQAVDRLTALRLVRRDGDAVTVLPALARFAYAPATTAVSAATALPAMTAMPAGELTMSAS